MVRRPRKHDRRRTRDLECDEKTVSLENNPTAPPKKAIKYPYMHYWDEQRRPTILALTSPTERRRPFGQRRGCGLSEPMRARPGSVPEARRLRLDRRAAQSADHRRVRARQELARLRARPKGLPAAHIDARAPETPLPRRASPRRTTRPSDEILVPPPRLERGTPRSTIWCSNQLSYGGTPAGRKLKASRRQCNAEMRSKE